MKFKDYFTGFTVERMAQDYTMQELRYLAEGLGFKFTRSPKKAQMCKLYSDVIFDNLDDILSRLSSGILSIIDDLVSIGNGKALFIEHVPPVMDVLDMLMICVLLDEDSSAWIVMPDELREAIGDKAKKLLHDEEHSCLDEKLQTLRGIVNMYGYCQFPEVFDLFYSYYPSEGHQSFFGEMIRCPEVAACIRYSSHEGLPDIPMLLSPYVREAFYHPEDLLLQVRKETKYRSFSREEALSAGKIPYPVFSVPAYQELRSFLMTRGGLSESASDLLLTDMWIKKQDFEASPMEAIKLFTGRIRLRSLSELNKAMELATKYTNSIPCWALRGSSSSEVERRQSPMNRPPKIIAGPGLKKAGYTDEQVQQMANSAFYGGVAEKLQYKAGRNDPCPCGSGLKFKNCHGKGN